MCQRSPRQYSPFAICDHSRDTCQFSRGCDAFNKSCFGKKVALLSPQSAALTWLDALMYLLSSDAERKEQYVSHVSNVSRTSFWLKSSQYRLDGMIWSLS